MFSWKPIYKELAQALLVYRDRQGELLAMLKEMQAKGLPVINLTDRDANDIAVDLAGVDPFTFFGNFNRGTTEEKRRQVLSFLKDKLSLSSPIPVDFDGIPVVHATRTKFFASAKERDPVDNGLLWDLAEACITNSPSVAQAYERCLQIKEIGVAKLTIGMFWLNPESFLALDSLMTDYIESKGIAIPRGK